MPPAGEAEIVHNVAGRPSTILELGCGTGRILRPLAALGHLVTGVDESPEMLAHCSDLDTVNARIETLDLGRAFDLVLLASHLLNTDDDAQRGAFLAAASRHLRPHGLVIIQWHPPDWFDTVEESTAERDGIVYHLHSLHRDGAVLHAVIDYRTAGRSWSHPFRARRLTEPELESALAAAGLRLDRWLDDAHRWLAASTA